MRRHLCFALLAALVFAAPAAAGTDVWTVGDQPGGMLQSVALDGQNALAASASSGLGGGLFRSTDGGTSWQRISAMDYREVRSVAIDPAPGQPWYAASVQGLFRSLDGGETWSETVGPAGAGAQYRWVAVDRGTPGTAYALSGNKAYRTTTGGSGPWTEVSGSLPAGGLDGVVVDPVTHTAWGRSYGSGVFVTAPPGTSWSSANVGLPSLQVTGLALDGSGSRRMIAGTFDGMAWLPAGGGPSWQALNGGFSSSPFAVSLSSDGAGSAYLTATSGPSVWRLPPGAARGPRCRRAAGPLTSLRACSAIPRRPGMSSPRPPTARSLRTSASVRYGVPPTQAPTGRAPARAFALLQ